MQNNEDANYPIAAYKFDGGYYSPFIDYMFISNANQELNRSRQQQTVSLP